MHCPQFRGPLLVIDKYPYDLWCLEYAGGARCKGSEEEQKQFSILKLEKS